MKFLIIDSDYPKFLRWLYDTRAGLVSASYDEQLKARTESLFTYADFFSRNLRLLDHEGAEVFDNNEIMQKMWAREHGVEFTAVPLWQGWLDSLRARIPGTVPLRPRWVYDILAAQIRHYRPDVLLNRNLVTTDSAFIREMKPLVRLVIGQHAAFPLRERANLRGYDLVVSSFPPMVDWFRRRGVRSELHRLGFEPGILGMVGEVPRTEELTFVGNFYGIHGERLNLIERLCGRFPQMKVWAPNLDDIPPESAIRRHWAGEAWGVNMFRVLASSKITVNHHGAIAPYANNLRLYEATGMGAMLVTDRKRDLSDIFEPGREVIDYESSADCIERIDYFLEHEEQRQAVAQAGQRRTLGCHTYRQRMEELVQIVLRYL